MMARFFFVCVCSNSLFLVFGAIAPKLAELNVNLASLVLTHGSHDVGELLIFWWFSSFSGFH